MFWQTAPLAVLAKEPDAGGAAGGYIATETAKGLVGLLGAQWASASFEGHNKSKYMDCMESAAGNYENAVVDLANLYDACIKACQKKKGCRHGSVTSKGSWKWLVDNPDYRK